MSYDYTVSDTPGSSHTAFNMPLKNTSAANITDKWSVEYTINHYLDAGVNASQLLLGFALYGHTWYVPGLTGDDWKKGGLEAQHQHSCCGPFKVTFGAKYGQGCLLCGTMMFSELTNAVGRADCPTYTDPETNSSIM